MGGNNEKVFNGYGSCWRRANNVKRSKLIVVKLKLPSGLVSLNL